MNADFEVMIEQSAPIGLTQNADNLFGAIRFAFHHGPPFGLRKTHAKTGSTIGGHASINS